MILEKEVKVKEFKDYGTITITDKRLKRLVSDKKRKVWLDTGEI